MIIDGNNFISHHLKKDIPFAAGKLGGNELQIIWCTLNKSNPWGQLFLKEVQDVAGLYPVNNETFTWFTDTLLADLKHLDLAPIWRENVLPGFEDDIFKRYCNNVNVTKLQHLEPYFFDDPWTTYLEGKKVAVFSPFAKSISNNFKNLSKIWNGKITPNFDLIPVQYPTAITITKDTPYKNSREIYDETLNKVHELEFDVGIFGTGHTGLPLALECKKIGKTGLHLGGATQIIFGIKGNRWEAIKEFQPFFNEYWTRPLESETPEGINVVEEACYW